jgi:hypothetical protein
VQSAGQQRGSQLLADCQRTFCAGTQRATAHVIVYGACILLDHMFRANNIKGTLARDFLPSVFLLLYRPQALDSKHQLIFKCGFELVG